MGLTIHYQLQANVHHVDEARRLVERLRQHALDLPFKEVGDLVELRGKDCDYRTRDRDGDHRWLLIQARKSIVHDDKYYDVVPSRLLAFSAWPGEGCEEANFGLCQYPARIEANGRRLATRLEGWSWGSFCKTQYSSNPECGGVMNFLRCHLLVVRMLDCAGQFGILQKVSDEGGYWEKRGVQTLAEEVGQWNSMIAGLVGQLKDLLGPNVAAPITEFPDFEHLEAKGRSGTET